MTDITQDMIDCWRINYGLDKRTPAEAAQWWHEHCGGYAPSGAVAALGTVLDGLDTLRDEIERQRNNAGILLLQTQDQQAEIDRLRAERERLRAALRGLRCGSNEGRAC